MFTPQDGNSLLSLLPITEWFLYPNSYEDKIPCLKPLFFDEVEIKDYVYQQICKLTDSKKIDNHRFLLMVSGGIDSQVLFTMATTKNQYSLNLYAP